MRLLFFTSCILAATTALSGPCAAYSGRAHTVSEIYINGVKKDRAPATVILNPKKTDKTITRGEVIYDGARIETPGGVKIVLLSTGGKSTTTIGPNSSWTPTLTGGGETADVDKGNVFFTVIHGALDFFRINHSQQFSASVQGTQFAIDTRSGVAFSCTRGAVDVTKTGLMAIGNQTSRISLVDVVSAGHTSHVVYHPTANWYLAKFANAQQAGTYFQYRLSQARRSGDPVEVAAATNNLHLVSQTFALKTNARMTNVPRVARTPSSDSFLKKFAHKIVNTVKKQQQKQAQNKLKQQASGKSSSRPSPRPTHR